MTDLLFSYGTLRQREVQVATFGRELDGWLEAADEYEVDDYRRVEVPLRSGRSAWVYVFAGAG